MIDHLQDETVRPGSAQALRFWWKLGWISFGGTAAHIAIMHDDLVERKKWISNGQFLHALSHCMLLPGPEAQQLAIYIGWKLHGTKGGIVAGALFVLPSMFVLLALSVVYVRFGGLPWIGAMLSGLKPAVVALVITATIRVARRSLVTTLQRIAALGAFAAMMWLHASLPLVMLSVILLGVLVGRCRPDLLGPASTVETHGRIAGSDARVRRRTALRVAWIVLTVIVLWLIPLFCLNRLSPDFAFWKQPSFFFTRTACVTFGGSYTVIPYVAQSAVTKYQWLSQRQMLDGFSLAETTPGPLIIVVAFVGFMAGFNHFNGSMLMGTVALLVTTFYTFLPCFLFVFAGAHIVEKSYGKRGIESVLRLITAVVVAAMLDLTVFLSRGVLFSAGSPGIKSLDAFALAWIGVSLLLLQRFSLSAAKLVGLSLLAGIARWSFAML
ncbi:MAG TPA: chromate efflux transporter [Terracidiphilus sp.]|jgi:chromate transporter